MDITFIIIAHDYPLLIAETVAKIVSQNQRVIIHYDNSSPKEHVSMMKRRFSDNRGSVCIISKIDCAWGEWSLVEAPLICIRKLTELAWPTDYVHLMSGLECPIKPLKKLEAFLATNRELDFIEAQDISLNKWVQGGMEIERLQYTFPYSYKTQRKQFFRHYQKQKKQKKRKLPFALKPFMGSQWWTLRFTTITILLDYLERNPQIEEFFSQTWIPDESFFQSLVGNLIPKIEQANTQLTYHYLGANGRPFIFMNGHDVFAKELPHFFIRKVSPDADRMLKLGGLESSTDEITLLSLSTAKEKADKYLTSLSDFNINRAWAFQGKIQGKVIFLIHDDTLPCKEIEAKLGDCSNAQYLHRPYSKKGIDIPSGLLARAALNKTVTWLRDNSQIEYLKALIKVSPEKEYYIISYIPGKDCLEGTISEMLENYCCFIIRNIEGNALDDQFLYSKILKDDHTTFRECNQTIDLEGLKRQLEESAVK